MSSEIVSFEPLNQSKVSKCIDKLQIEIDALENKEYEYEHIKASLIVNSKRGIFGDWKYDEDFNLFSNLKCLLRSLVKKTGEQNNEQQS